MLTPKITAAVLEKPGAPLVIHHGVQTEPLRRGQVLVKLAYSGVCRSQLMEARGHRGEDKYLPHFLGHEGSGQVLAIGEGVTKVAPGDLVILGWIKGTGIEAGGCKYHKNDTVFNSGSITTFSDYSVVSENRCFKIPEGIPLDEAVLFGCALLTGAGIVLNEIALSPEHTIAVWGMGGVGLSALLATQVFECKTVIAIDVEQSKLELASSFGATHLILSSQENALEKIMQITQGRGVDFSIEASGVTAMIEIAFQAVRRDGGLCIFASHPPEGETIRIRPHDLICGKQIRGTWGGGCIPDRDIPRLAELYRQGKLPLRKLLSPPYPLDKVNQLLDDLENRKVVRALIKFDSAIEKGAL